VGPRARLDIIERITYVVLARISTPDHPPQSLVTVLTTLFQFNTASYQNHYYLLTA
jgi:hypothetical protein